MFNPMRNRIQRLIGEQADCPGCGATLRRFEYTPTGKTRRTDPDLLWLTPARTQREVRCPKCSAKFWLDPKA